MIGRIRRAGALALVSRVERYGNLQRFARRGPLAATRSATNGHIVISSNNDRSMPIRAADNYPARTRGSARISQLCPVTTAANC